MREALSKTRSKIAKRLAAILGKPLNEEEIEEVEALLYSMDLGSKSTKLLIDKTISFAKAHPQCDSSQIEGILQKSIVEIMSTEKPLPMRDGVWLIVGVNGSGKTTTTAKLAALLTQQKKRVCVAACDTFRAAAEAQLELWSSKVGFKLIRGKPMSDPASVAFDALSLMEKENYDILLIDTAGRLESNENLLQQLGKIRRILAKKDPEAPHETLMVLDATIGQTALEQVRKFHIAAPLTGLVMTKLDGSAKGGVLVPLFLETKLPIRFVGVGEKSDDLIPFDLEEYAKALFG